MTYEKPRNWTVYADSIRDEIKNHVICGGIALINSPTGFVYGHQCGGSVCDSNYSEGFLLNIPDIYVEFDDCKYGCLSLKYYENPEDDPSGMDFSKESEESRKLLAKDLQMHFIKVRIKLNDESLIIDFDFNRINELKEGWWPVIIKWNGQKNRGYILADNCD